MAYVSAGILTPDEVRANMGLAPLSSSREVTKFNQNHLPPGPGGGQFTTGDGTGAGSALDPQRARGSVASAVDKPLRLPAGTQVAQLSNVMVDTAVSSGSASEIFFPPSLTAVPQVLDNETALPDNEAVESKTETGDKAKSEGSAKPLPKPEGIPDTWVEQPSRDGEGIIYVNPENPNDNIRVMPGKPESFNPWQQKPYVVDQNGGFRDVNGRPISGSQPGKTEEAHIPHGQFKFKR